MSNPKQQRDMQEAIDATLAPDAYKKLLEEMKSDDQVSTEYERLRNVDSMMRDSRSDTAPRSLATNILAKIANAETDPLPEPEPVKSTRSFVFGLCIGTVVILPALLVVTLLAIASFGSGTALGGVALGIIGSAAYLTASLNGLISFAGQLLAQYPLLLGALLLIPLALFGLHRLEHRRNGESS